MLPCARPAPVDAMGRPSVFNIGRNGAKLGRILGEAARSRNSSPFPGPGEHWGSRSDLLSSLYNSMGRPTLLLLVGTGRNLAGSWGRMPGPGIRRRSRAQGNTGAAGAICSLPSIIQWEKANFVPIGQNEAKLGRKLDESARTRNSSPFPGPREHRGSRSDLLLH